MERITTDHQESEAGVQGVFRDLQFSDCGEIARQYNRHLKIEDPIWCSSGSPYTASKLWAHYLSLMFRGRRQALTQVHRSNEGEFVSYFGGFKRGNEATFTVGIVNLDTSDPMEVWRRDSAVFMKGLLDSGVEKFKFQASGDKGKIFPWIEDDLGFERRGQKKIWEGDRERVERYVSGYSG